MSIFEICGFKTPIGWAYEKFQQCYSTKEEISKTYGIKVKSSLKNVVGFDMITQAPRDMIVSLESISQHDIILYYYICTLSQFSEVLYCYKFYVMTTFDEIKLKDEGKERVDIISTYKL